MQLSLFDSSDESVVENLYDDIKSRVVIDETQIESAWQWLCKEVNDCPNTPDINCYFDRKLWGSTGQPKPLEPSITYIRPIGSLYLLTQFGDLTSIIRLTNMGVPPSVSIYTSKIEERLKALIQDKRRFRAALSEHLAFWVYLATETRRRSATAFIRSRPNIKPEKQGPDGVSIALSGNDLRRARIEVHSVKNSTGDPSKLLSTATLRKKGVASNHEKLLDEFLLTQNGDSLIELDELLESVCSQLQLGSQQKIRMALLMKCVFNANVVADDSFASASLFSGYEFVVKDIERRTATYIGSSDWEQFAEETRKWVIQTLTLAKVW